MPRKAKPESKAKPKRSYCVCALRRAAAIDPIAVIVATIIAMTAILFASLARSFARPAKAFAD